MLTVLRIKNLALVSDLTLEFAAGYTAITGETGAGKSIVIGALNLVLGERADRTLIRSGADACTVEAAFDVTSLPSVSALLETNGCEPCESGQLLLKRTFSSAGANRQFINGSPATLNLLAGIGDLLVDMHGPHDHQSLLQPGKQLDILDAFGGLEEFRRKFAETLEQKAACEKEKSALIVDDATYAQQLDLLRFQVEEIQRAKLTPGEETTVEAEFTRASNAGKLLELTNSAVAAISDEEGSVLTTGATVGRLLHELRRLDPGTSSIAELHEQGMAFWRDLQSELSSYAEKVDVDPAQLAQLEERLSLIHGLRRKYGATAAEIIRFGEEAAARLQQLESRDSEIERLNSAISKCDRELRKLGSELSVRRQKIIPKLCSLVTRELNDLGFKRSFFAIEMRSSDAPARTGFDTVEFQFGPNPGEPARPLRAIASSGEMARVMLAIKTVLASEDNVPVLVFDEVDANVGGETAQTVGAKMAQIGKKRQVFCITHLAPVAAGAAHHLVVRKEVKGGRTVSEVVKLSTEERLSEIARMLGGQGEAVRKHAELLLNGAR